MPEGAVYHAGERTAVIADVHLGYEWARGAAGDCVLAHTLDESLARLVLVLARAKLDRLIDDAVGPTKVEDGEASHARGRRRFPR